MASNGKNAEHGLPPGGGESAMNARIQSMFSKLPAPADVNHMESYFMNPTLPLQEIVQQYENGLNAYERFVFEAAQKRLDASADMSRSEALNFAANVERILLQFTEQFTTDMHLPQQEFWAGGINKAIEKGQQFEGNKAFVATYDPYVVAGHLFVRFLKAQHPEYRGHILIEVLQAQKAPQPPTRCIQLYVFWDKEVGAIEKDIIHRKQQAANLGAAALVPAETAKITQKGIVA